MLILGIAVCGVIGAIALPSVLACIVINAVTSKAAEVWIGKGRP